MVFAGGEDQPVLHSVSETASVSASVAMGSNRGRNSHRSRGHFAPAGCRVRHCAGTTIRHRDALRTMALPGSLG